MRTLLVSSLLLASYTASAAEPTCASRAAIMAVLATKHREAPVAQGLGTGGRAMIEITASVDGASWTLLLTTAQGTCVLLAGTDWTPVAPPAGDPM
jgi:hypothetical protein